MVKLLVFKLLKRDWIYPSKTLIKITPVGKDTLISKIYKWEINSVERYKTSLTNNNQLLQINSNQKLKEIKFVLLSPTKYRELNDSNNTTGHSKIAMLMMVIQFMERLLAAQLGRIYFCRIWIFYICNK